MKSWLRTAIALLIGFTAASTAAQPAPKVTPPGVAQTPTGSGGVQDGIALHGNWVLDVRNPDGTLVAHREFKNALQLSGQTALAGYLAGQPLYDWYVTFNGIGTLDSNPTIGPLICANGPCTVIIPGGPLARSVFATVGLQDVVFPTLTTASTAGRFIMTGTFTVTNPGGGNIESVFTHLVTGTALSPASRVLTKATLPTPVPVAQGQIVQFTYTLSFS